MSHEIVRVKIKGKTRFLIYVRGRCVATAKNRPSAIARLLKAYYQ